MAEPPTLSVVVPAYQVAPYLRECLDSIVAQGIEGLEVIVVDDGSTDLPPGLVEDFAHRPGWTWHRVENGGLGRARGIGTRLATGRYLAFVDGDDRLPAGAYRRLVGTLEATGSDFALGRVRRFDGRQEWEAGLHRRLARGERLRTTIGRDPSLAYDTTAWNKVFRRDFWDVEGLAFPEGVLFEDIPVMMRAHARATSVDVLDDVVYEWRARPDSITQRRADARGVRDRVAAIRAARREIDDPRVLDAVDAKALETDLPLYLAQLPVGDARFRAEFLDGWAALLREMPRRERLPDLVALAVALIEQGRLDDLVTVMRARSDPRTAPTPGVVTRVRDEWAVQRSLREEGIITPSRAARNAVVRTGFRVLPVPLQRHVLDRRAGRRPREEPGLG